MMRLDIPLLEALAEKVGCDYLSDLRHLGEGRRKRLAFEIEKIQPEVPSLSEWNDALEYLAKEPPQASPEAARARLLDWLSQQKNTAVF